MSRPDRRPLRWIAGVFSAGLVLLVVVLALELRAPALPPATVAPPTDAALLARGAELARAGNCMACHTARGGAPYAGGRRIVTPFGDLYAGNLTPDAETGLGTWSPEAFRRAMHEGRSRDGRLLYPAFPYTHFTRLSREDSDAIYAYLRSLPADPTPIRPHDMHWPYGTQAALKGWRWLYFEAGDPPARPHSPGTVERGRYLTEGLGHCSACHAPRDRWGGASQLLSLAGGRLPGGWEAPSLLDPSEAGVQAWALDDVVALLGQGRSGPHLVSGPMAEVVNRSLRHWQADDLQALAIYLKQLPVAPSTMAKPPAEGTVDRARGAALYTTHCASCHGEEGQGHVMASGFVAYPALAGNRTVNLASPANLLKTVQHGGFSLPTGHDALPFGMPPFQMTLDDPSMAAVLTHVRQSWGNRASPVTPLDLHRLTE